MAKADAIMCLHRGPGTDTYVYWAIGTQGADNKISWTDQDTVEGRQSSTGVSGCNVGNDSER